MSSVDLTHIPHSDDLKASWQRNKFTALIAGVVVVSLTLVAIAINIYNSDGAAQLDMSRPGYSSVRSKVIKEDEDRVAYPSTGAFDQKSFDDFEKRYKKYADAVHAINGFDPSAVDNDSINLIPAEQPAPAN